MHEVVNYFSISESYYLIAIGFASIGTYLVFINQHLADLFGRRVLIFITLLGMGLSSLAVLLSQDFIQYTIALFFMYIFFSSDIWQIYLSEQCSEKHRAKLISLVLIVGAIGGALTLPLFRSLFLSNYGWRAMTWFALIAIPLSFIVFIFKEPKVYRNRPKNKENISKIKKVLNDFKLVFSKNLIKSSITICLLGFAVGFNYVFALSGERYLANYKNLSSNEIDLVITIIGLGAIAGYILSGFIADQFGRKIVIYLFSILIIPGFIIIIFGDLILIIIGSFIVSSSYWALFVTSRMIAYEIFPTNIRGTGAGFRSLSFAIGVTLGSISTSFTLLYVGLGFSYILNSLLLILILPLIAIFIKETKGIALNSLDII